LVWGAGRQAKRKHKELHRAPNLWGAGGWRREDKGVGKERKHSHEVKRGPATKKNATKQTGKLETFSLSHSLSSQRKTKTPQKRESKKTQVLLGETNGEKRQAQAVI